MGFQPVICMGAARKTGWKPISTFFVAPKHAKSTSRYPSGYQDTQIQKLMRAQKEPAF